MDAHDVVADKAYDEAYAVESEDEDLPTPASSQSSTHREPAGGSSSKGLSSGRNAASSKPQQQSSAAPGASGSGGQSFGDGHDESGSEESESSSEEASTSESSDGEMGGRKGGQGGPPNAYHPDDYKHIKVSPDVEELFQYITRYKPHTIELDTTLKPFIPELIPSIGEVDAFLKMPRPDGKPSGLGSVQLDEPTLNPSDPAILDLQLRAISMNQELQPIDVRCIENAEKAPKEIENWVRRIDELNRSKPAPTVQYSRRMPDIEQLMQVWPAEFEDHLQQNPLPELSELDLDLPDYIRVIASILDVPVYGQMTETLHVIFTLYSEFKSNQHFSKTDGADPYNFGPSGAFRQGGPAVTAGATTTSVFGPASESVAPSRAPSPVGQREGQMQMQPA